MSNFYDESIANVYQIKSNFHVNLFNIKNTFLYNSWSGIMIYRDIINIFHSCFQQNYC